MGQALALVVVLSGLMLGCGRGSFVGRAYDNFTAYYNTFYNANKAFEKGLESIGRSEFSIDRARYISIFPDPKSGSGGSSFEKAIQKSADLLRQHPNSKWVDDALLLIGRSRYYQQNYVGAAQKFREVIALGTEREQEARFRLAQTLVAADRYTEASEVLRTGLKGEAPSGTWTARMRLVRGELAVRQENWAQAETALQRGLEGPLPDEVGARAAFLLGQVRETLKDFDGAQAAYEQVPTYNPSYPLEFAARLGAIEMQGRAGAPNVALRRLEDLERGDDTKAMRGKIAITRARLYRALGRPKKAKQVLNRVLRGEEAPSGTVQGRIHYDLATLYRDTYEDFTRAAAHFDTASTTLSSGAARSGDRAGEDTQMLPRAPSDAAQQAERFRGLADRAREVARMDSLLRLGRMPPTEFQAFVQKLRRKRRKEQKQQARRRRRRPFRRGGQRTRDERGRSEAGGKNAVQTRTSDAGFLFHRDPTLVQQGRRQFRQTWGDRPLVDNWRRRTAIAQNSSSSTPTQRGARAPDAADQAASSGQLVDVSAVPRDSASKAQMRRKLAVAQYELANALFRAAGRPDSAETWFRRILEDPPDHPVTRQALYGLAQAHRAQGDTAAAKATYRRIIEKYPGTPYARRAREQLGLDRAEAPSKRAASKADSAYARAYDAWQKGDLKKALDQFFSVARTYPETSTAPRALLAAGVAYRRAPSQAAGSPLRTTFRRHVDSLVHTPDADSAGTEPRTRPATAAQSTPPSRKGSSPDSATTSRRASPPADTIAARNSPGPSPPRPSRADSARSKAAPKTASDSSRRDSTLQRPAARVLDSTTAAQLRPPARQPSRQASDSSKADSLRSVASRSTADSTASPPPASAPRDSAVSPFKVLLTHLTKAYKGTPAAERARTLLDHLRRRSAANPSGDTPSPDSTADRPVSPTASSGSAADSPVRDTTSPAATPPRPRPPDTSQSSSGPSALGRPRDSTSAPVQDTSAGPHRRPVPEPGSDTTEGGRRPLDASKEPSARRKEPLKRTSGSGRASDRSDRGREEGNVPVRGAPRRIRRTEFPRHASV